MVGPHVDRTVRRQLGGVDHDPSPGGVHPLGEVVDRRHDAGDVRRARHDEQPHPAGVTGELAVEVVEVERAVRLGTDVDGLDP